MNTDPTLYSVTNWAPFPAYPHVGSLVIPADRKEPIYWYPGLHDQPVMLSRRAAALLLRDLRRLGLAITRQQ